MKWRKCEKWKLWIFSIIKPDPWFGIAQISISNFVGGEALERDILVWESESFGAYQYISL